MNVRERSDEGLARVLRGWMDERGAGYLSDEVYDNLTGLPDRSLFSHRLAEAIVVSTQEHRRLAVLFLDLDHFRHVNESWGHAIGDRVLQSVAQRLLVNVRDGDVVSRYRSDEFAILFRQVAGERDTVIAERLLLSLRDLHRIDGHALHVTASIGLATFPDDGHDVESLLKSADLAMHQAKDDGRDIHRFFTAQMSRRPIGGAVGAGVE